MDPTRASTSVMLKKKMQIRKREGIRASTPHIPYPSPYAKTSPLTTSPGRECAMKNKYIQEKSLALTLSSRTISIRMKWVYVGCVPGNMASTTDDGDDDDFATERELSFPEDFPFEPFNDDVGPAVIPGAVVAVAAGVSPGEWFTAYRGVIGIPLPWAACSGVSGIEGWARVKQA